MLHVLARLHNGEPLLLGGSPGMWQSYLEEGLLDGRLAMWNVCSDTRMC